MRTPGSSVNMTRMPITVVPMMALMLSIFAVWFLYECQAVRPRCSRRGQHRSDCPDKETPS
jgi:hypothetical protein